MEADFQQSCTPEQREMFLSKLTKAMEYRNQPDTLSLRMNGKHTLYPPLELIALFQNSKPRKLGKIEHALNIHNSTYRPSEPMMKCCHFVKK